MLVVGPHVLFGELALLNEPNDPFPVFYDRIGIAHPANHRHAVSPPFARSRLSRRTLAEGRDRAVPLRSSCEAQPRHARTRTDRTATPLEACRLSRIAP